MRPRRRNSPVAGEHRSRTCELHRSQTRRVVRATLQQRLLRSRSVFDWLCTKSGHTRSSLCNLCVLYAFVVHYCSEKNNHRGTEHTEVAQRRSRIETFRAKPVKGLAMLKRLSLLILAFALQASWFGSSAFGQDTLP